MKQIFLILITIIQLVDVYAMASTNNIIRAQIFKMPEVVDLASVTTAGHYILSSHLTRPLLKLDKFGKIQSDLVLKWIPSKDFKTWEFHLANEKFSNGETITSNDVFNSLQRQLKFQTAVHFPFTEINEVKIINDKTFSITLKNARNDFIYDLTKPEFGVVYTTDAKSDKNQQEFKITSGPYYLSKKNNYQYILKKNPYFKTDVQNNLDLIIDNSEGETSFQKLQKNEIDFFTTQQNLNAQSHLLLVENNSLKAVKPHVAFSFWLSLNPNSEYFKSVKNRNFVQKIFLDFNIKNQSNHVWERSNQLYLPDGEGRPSEEELKKVWANIKKQPVTLPTGKLTLKIVPLKMTNDLINEVIDFLKQFYDVQIISYKTEEELIEIIKSNKFDIKISSNDFSSIDLSENLKTTFNASRPYIFLNKSSKIPKLLKSAVQTDNKSIKANAYKEIGLQLINDGLIVPLAYQRIWFYTKKSYDLKNWSSVYPEISFWKVKISEN